MEGIDYEGNESLIDLEEEAENFRDACERLRRTNRPTMVDRRMVLAFLFINSLPNDLHQYIVDFSSDPALITEHLVIKLTQKERIKSRWSNVRSEPPIGKIAEGYSRKACWESFQIQSSSEFDHDRIRVDREAI